MNGQKTDVDPGDRMAERIATAIASLVGVTIVAAGAAIYSHSNDIAQLRARCEQREEQLRELREHVQANPSPDDLIRCGSRLAEIERYRLVDEHRMSRLEAEVREMAHRQNARDPFAGSEGRGLRELIEALDGGQKTGQ